MQEIKLCKEIEEAIAAGNYELFLQSAEQKIIELLSNYRLEDVLRLINKTIIFHNCNIDYKETDYAKYQRKKHVSLRILLSLPLFCLKNIEKFGKEIIKDYEVVMDDLISKISEVQLIYYYYPCKNQGKVILDDETSFYVNYFKSFYFDYPTIEVEEFINFFANNAELCMSELHDERFLHSLDSMLYLQCIEENLSVEKFWLRNKYQNIVKNYFKLRQPMEIYPTRLVKNICRSLGMNYNHLIDKYAYKCCDKQKQHTRIIDVISLQDEQRFMVVTSKYVFFPRNYYWMFQLYNKIWRSKKIATKTNTGMTIKSQMHEEELLNLLQYFFGENNVFSNVYLKRSGREYAEKDFIVLYGDKVLSFEAKSNLLPEPDLEIEDGVNEIREKCLDYIDKAYEQTSEVRKSVSEGNAVFYDSPGKKNKIVLDLRNRKIDECLSIVVMYEDFINIETSVEKIYAGFDAWMVDIKNLKMILEDTVSKGKGDLFCEYIKKRKNTYGVISVQCGEEMFVYNLYKMIPDFFENNIKDMGVRIQL